MNHIFKILDTAQDQPSWAASQLSAADKAEYDRVSALMLTMMTNAQNDGAVTLTIDTDANTTTASWTSAEVQTQYSETISEADRIIWADFMFAWQEWLNTTYGITNAITES